MSLLCNTITEIILLKFKNMTILATYCHIKLNRESVYLHGQHVTEFLTNSCVLAYE